MLALHELIATLREYRDLDDSECLTLPPDAYVSPELYKGRTRSAQSIRGHDCAVLPLSRPHTRRASGRRRSRGRSRLERMARRERKTNKLPKSGRIDVTTHDLTVVHQLDLG